MTKKLLFVLVTFFSTVCLMAVQKLVFLLWYNELSASASWSELCKVVGYGLQLDFTIAGYITAFPLLIMLLSLWLPISDHAWRRILKGYFATISLLVAAIFAVDIALYEHWGFRLDGTILMYLSDPKEAMTNIDWRLGVRQTLFWAATAVVMIGCYRPVIRMFVGNRLGWQPALLGTLATILLIGLDFVAIRGGLGTSVANVSKVYFSATSFLNHAATNPVFSFLASIGDNEDFASKYPFFSETECAERFKSLRGNVPQAQPPEQVLRTKRPNIVVVILESFARTIMDVEVNGEAVMPNLQRLKSEGKGIWFENFFANSFRTDRGEVAILSGFPAQIGTSIMKLPNKSRNLPSIARSLGREGYDTHFYYGGDLNFTDQASYMYATGWQQLTWQKDLRFDIPPADWGYDDRLMCDFFAEEVITRSTSSDKPFLAGLLTLSSHVPFDVPYKRLNDRMLNAFAFTDDCIGRMIERLKNSPAWENLLVVLVADHGYPYPATLAYNEPLRHRIPMLWLGGAIDRPRIVEEYASQIDLCATLLGQMGIAHNDFDYSKDIFAPTPPRKFAYYTFEEGFGVVDATGEAIWDAKGNRIIRETAPELLNIGRTMLQRTFRDMAER
ncbi:MAG: LTA synthase family protein [Rikenellaceae bacterium]|nr:LTA synthase family protein [Rikenellaceae bacterium]